MEHVMADIFCEKNRQNKLQIKKKLALLEINGLF
jgi:hypothetical protein